jgi:hypothetical protein
MFLGYAAEDDSTIVSMVVRGSSIAKIASAMGKCKKVKEIKNRWN